MKLKLKCRLLNPCSIVMICAVFIALYIYIRCNISKFRWPIFPVTKRQRVRDYHFSVYQWICLPNIFNSITSIGDVRQKHQTYSKTLVIKLFSPEHSQPIVLVIRQTQPILQLICSVFQPVFHVLCHILYTLLYKWNWVILSWEEIPHGSSPTTANEWLGLSSTVIFMN